MVTGKGGGAAVERPRDIALYSELEAEGRAMA
jgi:hypothetical protein